MSAAADHGKKLILSVSISIDCGTAMGARAAIPCMHQHVRCALRCARSRCCSICTALQEDCSPVEANEQVGELVQEEAVCQELCCVPLRHQLQGQDPLTFLTSPCFTPGSAEQPTTARQNDCGSRQAPRLEAAFSSALWPSTGVSL